MSLAYFFLGLVAGIFAGLFGIGGGTIIIPALIFLFSFSQHQAQGTALAAMIPPISLAAALRYWQAGNVHLQAAAFICLGAFLGGFLGASLAQPVSEFALKKMFGIFLLVVSLRMIIGK